MSLYDSPFRPEHLDVLISELLVATADGCDPGIDRKVTAALQLLRRELGMDVVFVSEFSGNERVFRFVDAAQPIPGVHTGDSGPLEQSYCQRVVQGRMPELVPDVPAVAKQLDLPEAGVAVGAHLSTPVVLPDGRVYGTVCCFSAAPHPQLQAEHLERLRQCAQLVGRKVGLRQRGDFAPTEPDWSLQPLSASDLR